VARPIVGRRAGDVVATELDEVEAGPHRSGDVEYVLERPAVENGAEAPAQILWQRPIQIGDDGGPFEIGCVE
jgi:hypothetical protein